MKLKYPLSLQESWIVKSITQTINPIKSYTDPIIQKRFINKQKCPDGRPCLLRIYQFFKMTKDGCMTGVGNDKTHKVLIKFTFECIKNFETVNRQRITYNTLETLILINEANLRFINHLELKRDFDDFSTSIDVVILEVTECMIFNRDQMSLDVKLEKSLRFVYDENEYRKLCGRNSRDEEDEDEDLESIRSFE